MRIAFLTSPGTHPGSPTRRADAHEHDLQVAALRPALAELGHELVETEWRSDLDAFAECAMALIGTPWDYQDHEAAFLDTIDALEAMGVQVCNSGDVIRWNARKTYLRDLERRGVAIVPTRWIDSPSAHDIEAALEAFDAPAVVAKRQVGAGAEGQSIHRAGAVDPAWEMAQPAMLQPFLPAIAEEGEYSFLFVERKFSHALRKRPRGGDYRVQSIYGGTEEAIGPAAADLAAARAVINALPFDAPIYSRIDMVRGEDGRLLLMEAELIEPYLYPQQGPQLGSMLARAIDRRLHIKEHHRLD